MNQRQLDEAPLEEADSICEIVQREDLVTTVGTEMLADVTPGSTTFKAEKLAAELKLKAGTLSFAMAVSKINRTVFEPAGYHLSQRGQAGDFQVVPLNRSAHVADKKVDRAVSLLKAAVVYSRGVLAHHDKEITDTQKKRLERVRARAAYLAVLRDGLK